MEIKKADLNYSGYNTDLAKKKQNQYNILNELFQRNENLANMSQNNNIRMKEIQDKEEKLFEEEDNSYEYDPNMNVIERMKNLDDFKIDINNNTSSFTNSKSNSLPISKTNNLGSVQNIDTILNNISKTNTNTNTNININPITNTNTRKSKNSKYEQSTKQELNNKLKLVINQLEKNGDIFDNENIKKKTKYSFKHDLDEEGKRFKHLVDYKQGNTQGINFNYHRPESCGIDARNLGLGVYESLRRNGVLCSKNDYREFSKENPAPKKILQQIIDARKKACTCEMERYLTLKFYKKHNKDTSSHVYPYEVAREKCLECWQIEQEILDKGYLDNNDFSIFILYELLVPIIDKLFEKGYQFKWSMEKALKYVWDNLHEIDSKRYSEIKNNISYELFKNRVLLMYYYYRKIQIEIELEEQQKSKMISKKRKKMTKNSLRSVNERKKLLEDYRNEIKLTKQRYKKIYKEYQKNRLEERNKNIAKIRKLKQSLQYKGSSTKLTKINKSRLSKKAKLSRKARLSRKSRLSRRPRTSKKPRLSRKARLNRKSKK